MAVTKSIVGSTKRAVKLSRGEVACRVEERTSWQFYLGGAQLEGIMHLFKNVFENLSTDPAASLFAGA